MINPSAKLRQRQYRLWLLFCMAVTFVFLPCQKILADEVRLAVRITGLFSPDRSKELQEIVTTWPNITLAKLDFDRAEAIFTWDNAKVFNKVQPDQVVARLDDTLRNDSSHTFGVKPASTTPSEQLIKIDIPIVGLDCKACCLAAYEIVARIDGVEQATASFKDGRITARIDSKRTSKSALEAALKERGVTLRNP
jgi:copper chaperone CopZ